MFNGPVDAPANHFVAPAFDHAVPFAIALASFFLGLSIKLSFVNDYLEVEKKIKCTHNKP